MFEQSQCELDMLVAPRLEVRHLAHSTLGPLNRKSAPLQALKAGYPCYCSSHRSSYTLIGSRSPLNLKKRSMASIQQRALRIVEPHGGSVDGAIFNLRRVTHQNGKSNERPTSSLSSLKHSLQTRNSPKKNELRIQASTEIYQKWLFR